MEIFVSDIKFDEDTILVEIPHDIALQYAANHYAAVAPDNSISVMMRVTSDDEDNAEIYFTFTNLHGKVIEFLSKNYTLLGALNAIRDDKIEWELIIGKE